MTALINVAIAVIIKAVAYLWCAGVNAGIVRSTISSYRSSVKKSITTR
jgi:hypothetical protein